jgi:UDP-glucose 4-epimerase
VNKVLITGGLGFIGSNLTHKLVTNGVDVTILSRSRNKIHNISGIEGKVKINLKDLTAISGDDVVGKDVIFHLASTTNNYHIMDEPCLDINVNCTGTIALLEACRNYNSSARIIFPSTFFVNGNLENLPATPESPCEPLGLYPATRLAGEHFCKIYNRVFNMNSVIARLTNVFGIREDMNNKKKGAFNNLIKLACENADIPIYDEGNFLRDYIYVDDAVDGLITVAEKGIKGEIYYIGGGRGTKFRNLAEVIIEEASGGRIVSIEPPDFHKRVGIKNYFCDNSMLKGLGWEEKVSLREGIRRTVNWYKAEVKSK